MSADGTVRPIYTNQNTVSLNIWWVAHRSRFSKGGNGESRHPYSLGGWAVTDKVAFRLTLL